MPVPRSAALAALAALIACKPAAPTEDLTETFTGPFDRVEVTTDDGRAEFTGGEGDDVVIEFLPVTSDIWTAEEVDGVLVVTASCFGETEPGCNGGFLLTVPAGQAVTAKTDSGEIDFAGGMFGTLDAQTASGPINFVDVGAADATVLTGTGEVRARFAEEPTAVSFDSGSSLLSVAVPAGRYALDLDTTGPLSVADEIEDGNGPPLRLHSGTGNIDLFVYTPE